ncbi:MAG: leukocidin family pore-forming toxin, partial [Synergistaceae bacterium]|nr:leukocidin family pore-forming toxin [Synergistaceae bacterium]
DPNGPDSYRSEIAERLIAQDNVLDLAEFVRDSSMTAKKGDVLLYYPENGEDITAHPDYLSRLNDALNDGAVLAFVDITAEEIDMFTDKLELNLPGYLPDDATDEEKKALEDFYAFTVRLDSDDQTVENAYAYFGTELFSSDMELTVYSGDQKIAFNPSEYEAQSLDNVQYVDENGYILPAPAPVNYDYAAEVVDDFQEWIEELNTLKAISEASGTASAVHVAAGESAPVFPGVSASFRPSLFVSPRKFYNTDTSMFGKVSKKYHHERGVWRRDTSLNFNIVPVHSFSDGTDYYVFNVTGNTDPSQQYSHLSFMSGGVYEGLGNKKPGVLGMDHILGYNYQFQYTVMFRSGSNAVGTLVNSAPETLNDSKKISKGFTFQLDGNITGGYSTKDGLKGDASLKPSWKWESKEEYTVSDYVRSNISGGKRAGWKWEFQRPKNGDQGFGGVWLEDVPASGRSSVDLKSQFVMKVSKEEWKKYKDLKLELEFSSREGATEGGGAMYFIGNAGRRDYSYDWSKTQKDYTLPRPPHIAVTQAKFNYKATASKGDTQVVTLQSEEDWVATANASWIHLTTSDNNTTTKDGKESVSGKATGASQAQIMVSVDAVTDGKPRGGKVVFKASDGETCTIDVLQAGK